MAFSTDLACHSKGFDAAKLGRLDTQLPTSLLQRLTDIDGHIIGSSVSTRHGHRFPTRTILYHFHSDKLPYGETWPAGSENIDVIFSSFHLLFIACCIYMTPHAHRDSSPISAAPGSDVSASPLVVGGRANSPYLGALCEVVLADQNASCSRPAPLRFCR